MKKVLCVVGTRPEAIKMAPVILELKRQAWADVKVLLTAQHRQMLDQVNNFFGICADVDLDVMRPSQTLSSLTALILEKVQSVLEDLSPDVVLVQGDTTTVMAVSLACFYNKIPIGHIEAGLRTWDIHNPFPEEANRVIVSKLASWHFAPTESAKKNLIKDGVDEQNILVTGNTVIDALKKASSMDLPSVYDSDRKMVLVTSHRRENFGEPLHEICRAIKKLAAIHNDVDFLYPVHLNPNVRSVVNAELSGIQNVILRDPFNYAEFLSAMKRSYFVLTDSGGVQEEAPALGKPVLVLRDETERPEAVDFGVVEIVGPHCQKIFASAQRLLTDPLHYKSMAKGVSPYGDGLASSRIAKFLASR